MGREVLRRKISRMRVLVFLLGVKLIETRKEAPATQ